MFTAQYNDPQGMPRAWGRSSDRKQAEEAAAEHLKQYREEKRAVGDPLADAEFILEVREHAIAHNQFVAIGPNCWGIGKTQDEAIKKAKSNWPRIKQRPLAKNFSVWATDAPEVEKIHIGDIDGSVWVEQPHALEKLQTSALAVRQ